jgi:mono/diheme cytochrome c family protein
MRRLIIVASFFVIAIAAIASIGPQGCKAVPPGKLETALFTSAKHMVFVGNRKQTNPLPDNAQTLADGKEAFSHYCVACHGKDGQNTGVPFADRMSPPVPSLASSEVQRYSDGQLKWILDYGLRPSGMPGSKGMLSDEELWSIVVFLRHLPPAGSQGEPSLYAQ